MTFTKFDLDVDGDGIALITCRMRQARTMNLIDMTLIAELSAIVEQLAADAEVNGAIITSGKDTFCVGADLTMLEGLSRTFKDLVASQGEEAANARLFEESRKLSQLYRRIENLHGKPFVAAINGTALGGGFELALALATAGIAADDAKTRVGQPVIKVGLFPGAGGTQRIARILAPADALQLLLKGEQLRLDRAKALKLIDAVTPPGDLIKAAKDWIKSGGSAKAPWDVDGFKLPGGPVYSKAGLNTFPPANAIYRRETFDNYPAAHAVMQVVYEGLQLPMDAALRVESRWFAKILRSPEAAAMIRSLFVSMQDLNRGVRRPANVPGRPLKKIGVLGSGFMGAGIAYVSALAGLDVVLKSIAIRETAEKGQGACRGTTDHRSGQSRRRHCRRPRPRSVADQAHRGFRRTERLRAGRRGGVRRPQGQGRGDFADAKCHRRQGDLRLEHLDAADHTSLAAAFKDHARFIGIHFFSPVERMMLVEIIMGEETGDEALAVALDYVRAIRKTPIVVNDSRGFYTSRVVGTYLREGHLMLMEGLPAALIENVGRIAGMPVGPLALNDEVAVDLAWKILKATEADLGPKLVDPRQKALLADMVEKRGRLGRKNGKGFYDYPQNGPKRLWPGLVDLQPKQVDPDTVRVSGLGRRLLAIQALESARCIEEKVVTDVREADVGSILGFGFAPFTGGTISYIDGMGTKAFVDLCNDLAKTCGERFKPGELLLDMAKTGDTFYRRFPPLQRKAVA